MSTAERCARSTADGAPSRHKPRFCPETSRDGVRAARRSEDLNPRPEKIAHSRSESGRFLVTKSTIICNNKGMDAAKSKRFDVPDYGVGVGLRVPHYRHVIEQRPPMGFFEIISENFMVDGGKPLYHLDAVLETYPIINHGVSLSIGAPQGLDWDYLKRLKTLVKRVKPAWLSDHFCWTGVPGGNLHDLLPLPYTQEMIRVVSERARVVQDFLEVPFALENTSSYMSYRSSEMTEWQFVSEVVERADIGLMFDVNNVYVSAYNHSFDAYEFLRQVPHERILQIHLAGHTNMGKYIIDTHNGDIIDPVWSLYQATLSKTGPVSTLIEWDDEIPAFDELQKLVSLAEEKRALALRSPAQLSDMHMIPTATGADSTKSAGPWRQGGPREAASAQAVEAAE